MTYSMFRTSEGLKEAKIFVMLQDKVQKKKGSSKKQEKKSDHYPPEELEEVMYMPLLCSHYGKFNLFC